MHSVAETSPLHSVIRPQIWIHWCVFALCVSCWAGMLYIGDLMEQTDVGLRTVLGLRSGRLANFFSTIMLLWAGQLALLIYWYRRKSRNDFQGCYRLWLWIGVTLQFFLAVVATEGHIPFREYMQRVWPVDVPRYDLLCWLVPVATISLAMFRLLGIETRNSACSRALLWLCGLSAVIAGVSLVIGPLLPQRACDLLQVGSATLAHLGLATALLFHARYVIHVDNEAPPRRTQPAFIRRLQNMIRSLVLPAVAGIRWPRLPMPRLRMPRLHPARRKTPSPSKPRSSERPDGSKKSKRPPAEVAAADQQPKSAAPAAAAEKRRVDRSETPRGPKVSMQPSVSEAAQRVETGETVDEKLPSGLNKKERRRMRQLQRQAK